MSLNEKKNLFNACKITTIVDFFILGKAIMFMLGEMIPKLKGRQSKGATADSGSGQSISANKKNKKKKKGKWTKTTKQNFAVKKTLTFSGSFSDDFEWQVFILQKNCLSVFDHFVKLALKGLRAMYWNEDLCHSK